MRLNKDNIEITRCPLKEKYGVVMTYNQKGSGEPKYVRRKKLSPK